jgi:hypothetical protein
MKFEFLDPYTKTAILAAIGGAMKAILDNAATWKRLALEIVSGSLVGIACMSVLYDYFQLPESIVVCTAGVIGFGGSKYINKFERIINHFINNKFKKQ